MQTIDKKQLINMLENSFGRKIKDLSLSDKKINLEFVENLIFQEIENLPINEHGVYCMHKEALSSCSLEGYDMVDKIFNLEDARNFFHLFRIIHGFNFVNKYCDREGICIELGCGYGEIPKFVHSSMNRVNYYGFDLDIKKLNLAAKRRIGNFNLILIQCDLSRGELLIPKESVDVIVSIEFVEHIERDRLIDLMVEANRVLKNGGHILITTPNAINSKWQTFHIYEWEYNEFVVMMNKIGFSLAESFGFLPVKSDKNKFSSFRKAFPSSIVSIFSGHDSPNSCKNFSAIFRKDSEVIKNGDLYGEIQTPISDECYNRLCIKSSKNDNFKVKSSRIINR